MRNIKLVLEYDGTDFVGWQRQASGRTVQGEIESVLGQILREEVNVIGAGRTDSGVHARGQVANFRSTTTLSLSDIQNALQSLLPEDIVVRSAEEVPLEFHARYSARERVYSYCIATSAVALHRRYCWFVKYKLDRDLLRRCAELVVGEHDFSAFSKANSGVKHHTAIVTASQWRFEGEFLHYEIRANRFLHGMVRALVGTMVDVGRGYTPLQEFFSIFESRDRTRAGMAAPAKGLVLESVLY